MAKTPINTFKVYDLDGSNKEFPVTFEYLTRKFVRVTLVGDTRKILTNLTDYRFVSPTMIVTNQSWGPAQGFTQIEIRRYTSATERLVDFVDGSILRAGDLTVSQIQSMHIAEEARDLTSDTISLNEFGNFDAGARRIVRVADGVDRHDAVNKGQIEDMETFIGAARDQTIRAKDQTKAIADKFGDVDSAVTYAKMHQVGAELAKEGAEQARNEAEALVEYKYTFRSEQEGIAATQDGEYFRVPQGLGAEYSFIYYVNDAGSAVAVASAIGKDYVDKQVRRGPYRATLIPIHRDRAGNVPAWYREGRFEVADFGARSRSIIAGIPNDFATKYIRTGSYAGNRGPLVIDSKGNVPLWIDNGRIDLAGFGPNAERRIREIAGNTAPSPSPSPTPTPADVVVNDNTYIVGNIRKLMRKVASLHYGENVSVNMAWTGDSWTERSMFPQGLIDVIGRGYKDPGWISMSTRGDGTMAGITLTVSGYTKYDGDKDNSGGASPKYGCGPDGNAYYTNNGQTGTMTFKGVKATSLDIYYYDGDGTLTVTAGSLDPIEIKGGNTRRMRKYSLTGLSGTTAYSVKIDSAESGVTSLFGMYGRNSAKPNGITVSRMGNGGAVASDYLKWMEWIPGTVKDFDLDLVFILLGTNDFRKSLGTKQFKDGIIAMISAYRQANPDTCFCLVSPAQSNASGTPTLDAYDDAMREIAIDLNTSYVSGYKIHSPVYNKSNGEWVDNLHMSKYGVFPIVSKIRQFILGGIK